MLYGMDDTRVRRINQVRTYVYPNFPCALMKGKFSTYLLLLAGEKNASTTLESNKHSWLGTFVMHSVDIWWYITFLVPMLLTHTPLDSNCAAAVKSPA